MQKLKQIVESFVPWNEQENADREKILAYIDGGEELLTRENDRMHFTSSAWVMNPERTKVLMVHHNIYNAWSWIGGHADGCGDLFVVAQKELEEETGVSNAVAVGDGPITLEMIGVQAHEKKGKYIAPHIHLNVTYLFEVGEDVDLRVKEDENSGVMWRSIDDVRQDNTEPHMRKLYCKLLDKLEK